MPEIRRVWDVNMQVYGAKKVWWKMKREEITIARCTVDRLMKQMGLEGARRGDKGSQYVSIHYTERLVEAGIEPSAGSVGCQRFWRNVVLATRLSKHFR